MVRRLSAEMRNLQRAQHLQCPCQASHGSKSERLNNHTTDIPVRDSGSASPPSKDRYKVSMQDIEFVQKLIERHLQLYMNKDEVVETLLFRAKIDPEFTTLVWQKLEKENVDFFRVYYIRLKLKKQMLLFNNLLEHHCHMMKCPPLAPIQNGIHSMPVNNLPIGYPVLQQPSIPAAGQPHLDSMRSGISSCHAVNGVPALNNFHPVQMNSGNSATSSLSEMPVGPTSVAPNDHLPITASDVSAMDTDALAAALTHDFDVAFTSDVASSIRSLDQIQWNFSLSDPTIGLSNLKDPGALGNYPAGSPFMQSDSDILLQSSNQKDIVDDFFINTEPQGSQSDEKRS